MTPAPPPKKVAQVAEVAIRHRRRGKAHRLYLGRPVSDHDLATGVLTHCNFILRDAEQLPVETTAPEDRCRICWPAGTFTEGSAAGMAERQ